jgi:uncharacterized membrane protein
VAYDVAVFLHLLSLFGLIGAITTVVLCNFRLRGAGSIREAGQWARLIDQASWAFPVAVLGLVATGVYLTTERWTWSTSWILVSIAALFVDTVQGPLIAGPRAKALRDALTVDAATGVLDAHVRKLAYDRVLWVILFANPGIVLAITWNMTVKPGTAGAIAAVLVGYGLGVATGLLVTRQPQEQEAPTGASISS